MLNIEVNRSAEGVERYFDRELALSDYLMKEPGVWAGRGAERLEFTDANHIGHLRSAILCCALPTVTAYVGPHTFGLVVVDGAHLK